MDGKIFDTLQEYIKIEVRCAQAIHKKRVYERGFKLQNDLWIVKDGEIAMNYNQKDYMLKKGDIFLMYPNVSYEATFISDSVTLIYCHFNFSIGNSTDILNNFSFDGHIQDYQNTNLEKSIELFINAFCDMSEENNMSKFICKQYFNILLSNLISYKLTNNSVFNDNNKSTNKIDKLYPVIDYLYENIHRNISVLEMSTICQISEKYFITYFKQVFGISPSKYHTKIKMEKAIDLILARKLSIKEIAYQLGFSDQYNFSTAFKKQYGVPPSKYV